MSRRTILGRTSGTAIPCATGYMPAVVLPAVRPYNDFIQCYLTVNSRSRSPIYLYGESYGTPRTNMLALALESAW